MFGSVVRRNFEPFRDLIHAELLFQKKPQHAQASFVRQGLQRANANRACHNVIATFYTSKEALAERRAPHENINGYSSSKYQSLAKYSPIGAMGKQTPPPV